MREEIRWIWSRLNSTYWFYPALFSFVSLLLAMALIYLDRHGFADFLNDQPWLQPARPQSASNMLNVIAGSMIGVASTVFSITIAAVAYASGNYGPRLLTNFMEDRGNQLSLATFIGTFVYAITVLRTVRLENEAASNLTDATSSTLPGFVPQLSLLGAYALMAISVAVLVYFLNHIPSSIRINTVLEGIGERLLKGVAAFLSRTEFRGYRQATARGWRESDGEEYRLRPVHRLRRAVQVRRQVPRDRSSESSRRRFRASRHDFRTHYRRRK